MTSHDTVLVVAAHPDDEVLGCGGAIARHAAGGDDVHILFLSDGVTSRRGQGDKDVEARREMAMAVARKLGAHQPRFLDFPDNRLDGVALLDVVGKVEEAVADISPQVVYTHHGGDLNVDHRIAHQAVVTACRPVPGFPVTDILCFEVLSSTEWGTRGTGPVFSPVRYVEITDFLDLKKQALELYTTEMAAFPHPRSLEALEAMARLRGAGVGVHAAEAFEVVREIVPMRNDFD